MLRVDADDDAGSGEKYPELRKQLMTLLPELPSPALFVANSLALSAPGP